MCACVCVCVRERERERDRERERLVQDLSTSYVYCVCVRVCVRERERERYPIPRTHHLIRNAPKKCSSKKFAARLHHSMHFLLHFFMLYYV